MEKPDEFARFRLEQLKLLSNRFLDRPIRWSEFQAVRKPFYSGFTYKNEWVPVQADPELTEQIRGRGIYAFREDLKEFGYVEKADELLPTQIIPPAEEEQI